VNAPIDISREVAEALHGRRAVVALETTLVAHGFSDGRGLDVARESERRVRGAGAVPATVGVIDGTVRVGLADAELERFAAEGAAARKVGPRDIAACAVQGAIGATTVGGTLAICRVAGIGFMATGGLGGVHRGFPEPPDVSADLAELARTEVLVVSSGVKSLLDTTATAEVLETLGIPVLGFRTDELPRFYTARGGPPVSARVESAEEAARIARAHWQLGRRSALVLANPPAESLDDVEPLIEEALGEARRQSVSGQAVTPFVLARLHERSGGRTVEVNARLIADNAGLAGEVAVAYAGLGRAMPSSS
jgi:pseudouridine-5'-phosphate glycosidase